MKIVEQHIPCPNCPSSDAYCTWEDGHGYCFSCQHYTSPKSRILQSKCTYQFLGRRGISEDTHRFYGVKTKVGEGGEPISVAYPYPNGSLKVRTLTEKSFYTVGDISRSPLFGSNLFEVGKHKFVTITEGEDDALSLYQVLQSPVVSVKSASSAATDCSLSRSWLNQFERIYLAFDNDRAGREACANVARLFDYNKIYDVKFHKHKDPNDYLVAGESEELKKVWWAARKYLPDNLKSSLDEFRELLSKPPAKGVPYPWKKLTEMTDGIRPGEIVLLTAQEGIGKTEIMRAIEYQLLKETKDAIGAIFLEEPQERHLRGLASIELQRPVHLRTGDQSETIAAVERVVQSSDRLFLYSHFGSDDPVVVLDTIRFLATSCNCRYILLDHLSMVVSGSSEVDERRELDNLSTKLSELVTELQFSLIMVSHVNDDGRTRGSRYISKVAHIRVDLTRDLECSDERVRNTTKLRVSKNRPNCRTGLAGQLLFCPNTWLYQEIEDEQQLQNPVLQEDQHSQVRRQEQGQKEENQVVPQAVNDNSTYAWEERYVA